MTPCGRQDIAKSAIPAVAGVLQPDFLTQGPRASDLKRRGAACCGTDDATLTGAGQDKAVAWVLAREGQAREDA